MPSIKVPSFYLPSLGADYQQSVSFSSALVIDATGEKAAMLGHVWRADGLGGNIVRLGWRFGAVTKAGGSGLVVSLQNVDLANGPPARPDETQDQTVAVANGNSSFVSNTWIRSDTLSAARSVTFGEPLAVVWEFDGSGRLGSDSVNISALQRRYNQHGVGCVLKTASWAAQGAPTQNVILEFDDGVFGSLSPTSVICSAAGQTTFNQSTAGADEYALEFSLPFACQIDGGWFDLNFANSSSDLDIVVYDGTTELVVSSIDANVIQQTGGTISCPFAFPAISLAANTIYRLAVRPSTSNNVTISHFDVADANHFQAMPGGPEFRMAQRLNLGSWTTTTTRRPFAGVRVCAVDIGGGSGGFSLVGNGGLVY